MISEKELSNMEKKLEDFFKNKIFLTEKEVTEIIEILNKENDKWNVTNLKQS